MIRNHSGSETRSAFTLVELIVVILIIAILVSLIGSAVIKAMQKIPEVSTRTEISEFDIALRAFMSDYNLTNPPPSTLILNETAPLSTPSANFLQQAFGKTLGSTIPPGWTVPGVDWNGDGIPNGPWVLEGEQCLVFYLGGIPTAPGVSALTPFAPQGFSTNNINPGQPGGKRKGPYYTFQTPRLVSMLLINPQATSPNGPPFLSPAHPVYLDAWQVKFTLAPALPPFALHSAPFANGIPYAYFSSQGINNMYGPADCASIGAGPYFLTGTNQFTNPNTYQIISAGKNGTFGIALTGTPGWVPSNGAQGAGADDQANFSGGLLGAGQQ